MGADRENLENHNTLEHDAQVQLAEWAEALRLHADAPVTNERRQARHRSLAAPEMLAGVRQDDDAFAFLRGLLDAVMGAGDPFAAALGLRDAAAHLPESLPLRDRLALRAGSLASLGVPWAVLPLARKWLRERVSGAIWSQRFPVEGHENGSADALRHTIEQYRSDGCETVLLLTGDAVLGAHGVALEVGRLSWLVQHSGVRHIAIDPQRLVTGITPWSDDADAETGAHALRPVLELAAQHGVSVTLKPHSYHGALLAPEILFRAFADTDFDSVHPGIWLPAELPESGALADRLIRWSRARVRGGGAALTVTTGHTGFTGAEHVSSLLTGLAVPTLPNGTERDTHLLRIGMLLSGAATKGDLEVVYATEDPRVLAHAIADAHARNLNDRFALQLRAGVADELAHAIASATTPRPALRIELPITPDHEHEGLLHTLVALAAESCEPGSPLTRAAEFVTHAHTTPQNDLPDTGRITPDADTPYPRSHRTQRREREGDPTERDSPLFYRPSTDTETFDTGGLTAAVLGLTRGSTGKIVREPIVRELPVPTVSRSGWANEPLTDALVAENREWMRRRLRAAHELRHQWHTDPHLPGTDPNHPQLISQLIHDATPWRELRPIERSVRVRRLALGVAAARDQLFTVLAAESGAPVSVLDAEINGAIDAARSLAPQTAGLGSVRGAEFHSDELTLVVCTAGIPLDERAEAILAALATGSAVLCVTHPSVARSTHLLCQEWEAAGLPHGVVQLVVTGDTEKSTSAIAAELVTDTRIARALVLGSRDDALTLRRQRPALRTEGRFRTLGSAAITPSAHTGTAIRESVRSAFGAGHRSAHHARALILLGTAARSTTLLAQLEDAIRALRVGDTAGIEQAAAATTDPLALTVGPLTTPPTAAGLRALTELHPGERWLVQPEALDPEWRLWSPGVRIGVKPHSPFWADAVGMPVIGVATARTVPEMITLQSQLGGGSVAALFATDPSEVLPWIDGVYAARITVGHATAPAQVERHPGGGWGAAGMGNELLIGGPHRLLGLGSWRLREGTQSSTLHLRGLSPEVQLLIETAQPELDYRTFDQVRRAALSDALAWRTELGRLTDTMRLTVRQHLVRRRPVRTHVRLAEHAPLGDLVRVLAAALVVNAPLTVSTGVLLPDSVSALLESFNISVSLERDDDWLERMAVYGPDPVAVEQPLHKKRIPVSRAISPEADRTVRIRLIGGDAQRTAEWLGVPYATALWVDPVTMAGPLELLAFVREQAISINGHDHGMATPAPGIQGWIEELDERVAAASRP